jgi:hypothetical protein
MTGLRCVSAPINLFNSISDPGSALITMAEGIFIPAALSLSQCLRAEMRPALGLASIRQSVEQLGAQLVAGQRQMASDITKLQAAGARISLKDFRTLLAFATTGHGDVARSPQAQWELNTYVTCEVLGWRGIWTAEERRRRA